MVDYIDREALLHDVEQSVVCTTRDKEASAEMRGANKIVERIKCAAAVEPVYIHEPTKSEFKRMAAQMGYVPVVRCEGCVFSQSDGWVCGGTALMPQHRTFPNSFCSFGERKDERSLTNDSSRSEKDYTSRHYVRSACRNQRR